MVRVARAALPLFLSCALGGCLGSSQGPPDQGVPFTRDLGHPAGDGGRLDAGRSDGGPPDLKPPPPDLSAPPVLEVYVSGYAPQISRWRFDATSGAFSMMGTTAITGSPSFLAVDPARKHLYALDETNSVVRAFDVDGVSGALTPRGAQVSSGGSGPAFLSVHPSGKWVMVANYGNGNVAVLPIAADGSLTADPAPRLAGAMAHQIIADATGAFVWAPCLGGPYVAQYTFANGALTPSNPATATLPAGSGPRHMALHPNGKWAYVIDETDSTMRFFTIDGGGHLTLVQSISTRAPGAAANNTGAEVVLHPSGNFLFGSNRGDDDIVRYSIGAGGMLVRLGNQKLPGATPRSFTVDASGKWMLVAEQGSNDVVEYTIDAAGNLALTANKVLATMPSFVGVVALP